VFEEHEQAVGRAGAGEGVVQAVGGGGGRLEVGEFGEGAAAGVE